MLAAPGPAGGAAGELRESGGTGSGGTSYVHGDWAAPEGAMEVGKMAKSLENAVHPVLLYLII